jgi:hypothetical protein
MCPSLVQLTFVVGVQLLPLRRESIHCKRVLILLVEKFEPAPSILDPIFATLQSPSKHLQGNKRLAPRRFDDPVVQRKEREQDASKVCGNKATKESGSGSVLLKTCVYSYLYVVTEEVRE